MAIDLQQAAQTLKANGFSREEIIKENEAMGFNSHTSQVQLNRMLEFYDQIDKPIEDIDLTGAEVSAPPAEFAPLEGARLRLDEGIPEGKPYSNAMDTAQLGAYAFNQANQVTYEGDSPQTNTDMTVYGQQHLMPEGDEVGFVEAFKAEYVLTGDVFGLGNKDTDILKYDPKYIPENDPVFNDLQMYKRDWIQARSAEEGAALAANIQREVNARDVQARTSAVTGFIAGTLVEFVNPINAPLFFIAPIRGASAVSHMAKWTGAAISTEAVSEALRHHNQIYRTQDETVINLAMTAILGSMFDGLSYKYGGDLNLHKAAINARKSVNDPDSVVPPSSAEPMPKAEKPDEPAPDEPDAPTEPPKKPDDDAPAAEQMAYADSAGAKRADPQQVDMMLHDFALAPMLPQFAKKFKIDTGQTPIEITPIGRLSASPFISVRALGPVLVDSPFIHNGHKEGKTIGHELGSVEASIRQSNAPLAKAVQKYDDIYFEYKVADEKFMDSAGTVAKGLKKGSIAFNDATKRDPNDESLNIEEFNIDTVNAIENRQDSDIAQINSAAKVWGNYFDEILDEAIELGALPERVRDEMKSQGRGYFPRVWNVSNIPAREFELREILTDNFVEQQQKDIQAVISLEPEMQARQFAARSAEYENWPEYQAAAAKGKGYEVKLKKREAPESETTQAIGTKIEAQESTVKRTTEDAKRAEEDLRINKEDRAKVNTWTTEMNEAQAIVDKETTILKRDTKKIHEAGQKVQRVEIGIARYKEGTKMRAQWEAKLAPAQGAEQALKDKLLPAIDERTALIQKQQQTVDYRKDDIDATPIKDNKVFDDRIKEANKGRKAAEKEIKKLEADRVKAVEKDVKEFDEYKAKLEKDYVKVAAKYSSHVDKAEVSREELDMVSQDFINKITSSTDGSEVNFYDDIATEANPFKRRQLKIPREKIQDFLINDPRQVAKIYNRATRPRMEMRRRFGSIDLKDKKAEIADEYQAQKEVIDSNAEINNTPDATKQKQLMKLKKDYDTNIKDIDHLLKRIYGRHRTPADPTSVLYRTGKTVMDLNYMRMLGFQTLSAFPDIGRAVMVNGLGNTMETLSAFVKSPEIRNMAIEEVRDVGAAFDYVLNSGMARFGDIEHPAIYQTKVEKGIGVAAEVFSKMTMMPKWNDWLKQFVGVGIQKNLLKSITTVNRTPKQTTALAKAGINEEMAERIAVLYNKHGSNKDTIMLSGAANWTKGLKGDDLVSAGEASMAFRNAMNKTIDETIVTPGMGDMPVFLDKGIAPFVMQFKSFAFAANSKVMVAGLQQNDADIWSGAMLSAFAGFGVYWAKETIKGNEIDASTGDLAFEAADRSGLFGLTSEVLNLLSKGSGGALDVSRLWGSGNQLSRYQSRTALSSFLGPSFQFAEEGFQVGGAIGRGEIAESDIKKMRRAIPLNNWFLLNELFNQVEESAIDEFAQ